MSGFAFLWTAIFLPWNAYLAANNIGKGNYGMAGLSIGVCVFLAIWCALTVVNDR